MPLWECNDCNRLITVQGRPSHLRSREHVLNQARTRSVCDITRSGGQCATEAEPVHSEDLVLGEAGLDETLDGLQSISAAQRDEDPLQPEIQVRPSVASASTELPAMPRSPTSPASNFTDEGSSMNSLGTDIDGSSSEWSDVVFQGKMAPRIESNESRDWHPFPSATFFWLFLLCSMPEHPISVEFQKFLWFVLEQLGLDNLPSINSIREFGDKKLPRPKVVEGKSSTGESFYFISPSDLVRQEVSKPEVQQKLNFYPVDSAQVYNAFCQGEKWRMHPSFQSPMVAVENDHYFVGDFVYIPSDALPSSLRYDMFRLFSQFPGSANSAEDRIYSIVRLDRFYAKGFAPTSRLFATATALIRSDNENGCVLDCGSRFDLPITSILALAAVESQFSPSLRLSWRLVGFLASSHLVVFKEKSEVDALVYSFWRNKAAGRRVVNVPVVLGTDETSGNKSKKWNHHEQYFLKLAGWLTDELFKLHNVHVLCTSNRVSFAELGKAIVDDLNSGLAKGVVGVDYSSPEPRELLIVGSVLAAIADNPRAAQLCSQDIACTAFCRCCTIRKGGTLRPWENFQRSPAVSVEVLSRMKKSNKAECARLRVETGIVFGSSVCDFMFKLNGFNPHEDIPIEILHTLLLGMQPNPLLAEVLISSGLVRYLTIRNIAGKAMPADSPRKRVLVTRYSDLSFDGFKYHPSPAYVKSYAGSFVGKDFKAFVQVAPFVMYDVVSDGDLRLWIVVARIVKILYVSEIRDVGAYYCALNVAVNDVYAAMFQCAPDLLHKPKVHMLFHAITHINRFGPLMLSATEKEEQKNGKVRKILFQTNRNDASRDVAAVLARHEGLQCVVQRGIWPDPQCPGKYSSSGSKLMDKVARCPEIRRMVGIDEMKTLNARKEAEGCSMSYWYYPLGHNSKAPVTLKLSDTDLFLSSTSLQATITLLKEACPPGLDDAEFVGSLNSGRRKFRCWQRVNINGYPTGEKSFVLATQNSRRIYGRVRKIYSLEKRAFLSIEVYEKPRVAGISQLDLFGNQRIVPANSKIVVRVSDVLELINVQHDCRTLGCTQQDNHMHHSESNQFVLNQFKIASVDI